MEDAVGREAARMRRGFNPRSSLGWELHGMVSPGHGQKGDFFRHVMNVNHDDMWRSPDFVSALLLIIAPHGSMSPSSSIWQVWWPQGRCKAGGCVRETVGRHVSEEVPERYVISHKICLKQKQSEHYIYIYIHTLWISICVYIYICIYIYNASEYVSEHYIYYICKCSSQRFCQNIEDMRENVSEDMSVEMPGNMWGKYQRWSEEKSHVRMELWSAGDRTMYHLVI